MCFLLLLKSTRRKFHQRDGPSQKFVLKDGFISPLSETSLAVGVVGFDLDNLSPNTAVTLCRKSIDDPGE